MKILILGLTSSIWTIHFVEECLLKNNYEVWILKKSNQIEDKKYTALYRKKGIHFIDCTKEVADIKSGKDYIKVLFGYYSLIRKVVKAGDFDMINLHYVVSPDLIYAVMLKYVLKTKLVLSYWGSDLLRIEDKALFNIGKFARFADFVTFDNKDLEIKFKETYKWSYKVQSEVIMFGLPVLDIINEKCKSKSQTDLRKKWNIPIDKTVIAVGYRGIPEQQHIKILKAIEKLDNQYKKKIFLLIQMTYGGTKEYRCKVIASAKKTGCEYMEIQRFLSDDEVADLRMMTDIFINAQTTDAFSGSVCENLFSGSVLINAKWLYYQEFKDNNFKYLQFENINEVGQLIQTVMEQEMDLSENKKLIWQLRSWEYCAPKWKKVFLRMMRKED